MDRKETTMTTLNPDSEIWDETTENLSVNRDIDIFITLNTYGTRAQARESINNMVDELSLRGYQVTLQHISEFFED